MMEWLSDTQWLVWLGVALAAGVIEIVSLDFFFLMLAGGALIASGSAALDAPGPLQVIIFSVASGVLLLLGRPALKSWAQSTPVIAMHSAALVGREARVLETVTDRSGTVKLAGEVWTARPADTGSIEVGSAVHVVRIEGATAVVAAVPAPPASHFLEGNPTP